MKVRLPEPDDAIQIAYIYNHYIATSDATFELEPIDGFEMRRRMTAGRNAGYPFLVCAVDDVIVGYALGKPFRPRPAYGHTIEISVYVKPGQDGQGIASALYTDLLNEIGKCDFHAVIAGIALPNDASVALHEKFGFKKVAHFRDVGRKFDRWIDVGYWERILA
jgi:L-amino acid N-acyltransferase YncA